MAQPKRPPLNTVPITHYVMESLWRNGPQTITELRDGYPWGDDYTAQDLEHLKKRGFPHPKHEIIVAAVEKLVVELVTLDDDELVRPKYSHERFSMKLWDRITATDLEPTVVVERVREVEVRPARNSSKKYYESLDKAIEETRVTKGGPSHPHFVFSLLRDVHRDMATTSFRLTRKQLEAYLPALEWASIYRALRRSIVEGLEVQAGIPQNPPLDYEIKFTFTK